MRNRRKSFNNDLDREANAWFDQTDDNQPFDAFGSNEAKQRIGEDIFKGIRNEIHKKRFNRYYYLKIASVIVFLSGLGILASMIIRQHLEEQRRVVWSEVKSLHGHLDKMVLSDSSVVYLRPGSVLKFPQKFKGHLREVQLLEGEAFFEVKHDANHPFIVLSGRLSTQVLGTSFLIKNYKQLKHIQVSVATGKVAVMNGKKLLRLLTPQQQLTFNTLTDEIDFTTISAGLADNWKSGEYVLKNASISELALQLENIYGLKVILKSPDLQKLSITTQFNMKDNIRDILEQLKLIHHVNYVIKNKEVALMK